MEWNEEIPDPSEVREPAIAYGKSKFTIEEYLEMERAAVVKSEYYQGEIFTMSGASPRHNVIFNNLFADLSYRSKGKSCRPYPAAPFPPPPVHDIPQIIQILVGPIFEA